jgi:prepilin-type N-terminal cleavage/methylation domain-containing protein
MRKGFTLVELLVVISIVGMLASITLATLSGGRSKAIAARIVSQTLSLRNSIELSWDGTSYADLLPNDAPDGGASVAPYPFPSSGTNNIVDSILSLIANGQYGGGVPNAGVRATGCGTAGQATTYRADSFPAGSGDTINSLTIYTNSFNNGVTCTPVTKYAIYAAYPSGGYLALDPLVPTAYAVIIPSAAMSGYFCIDSAGNALKSSSPYIPKGAMLATCQ